MVDNFNGLNRPQLAYDSPTEDVALICHFPAPLSFVGEPRQTAGVELALKGEAWRLGPRMPMWAILAGTTR